jgi:hypothetical protein
LLVVVIIVNNQQRQQQTTHNDDGDGDDDIVYLKPQPQQQQQKHTILDRLKLMEYAVRGKITIERARPTTDSLVNYKRRTRRTRTTTTTMKTMCCFSHSNVSSICTNIIGNPHAVGHRPARGPSHARPRQVMAHGTTRYCTAASRPMNE